MHIHIRMYAYMKRTVRTLYVLRRNKKITKYFEGTQKNHQDECILIYPTHSRNYKYMYKRTFT